MADEIKKIITIDTGQGITSLKDYKKHIDELRGSLLQLDDTSEEYQETAKEIKREQDKLNEVMKVGKGYTDAAEGSYNQLVQTMADLKKQWRATADEAERASLGSQILDINNKLKELDASTGNFQRNVGDYSNAFEEAFKNVLGGLQGTGGALGDVAKQTLGLLPLIKSVNSTATAGLSGIRKGVASTGIGGIIILVSQLITHWKELTAFIGISDEEIANFKEGAVNAFKNIITGAVGVGNALLQYLLTPVKTIAQGFIGLGNIVKDVFTGDFKKIKEDAVNALGGITEAFKSGFNFKQNFEVGKQIGEQFVAGIQDRIAASKPKAEEAGAETGKAVAKSAATAVKESTKEVVDATAEMVAEAERAAKEQMKEYNADLKALNDEARQAIFDAGIDIDNEQEKANRIYEINRQLLVDKIQLQQDYLDAFLGDIDEQLKAEENLAALKQELANLDKKRAKEVSKEETKQAQEAAKNKKAAYEAATVSISTLFGSLSEMFEEGSSEQKAFAIMEATINTIAGAIGAFMKASETYPSPWGQIIGGATAAAVTTAGITQINKIRSTTKDNASNPSSDFGNATAAVSTIPNVGVSPLLNEGADIQNLQSLNVAPDSTTNNSTRVYVVESDITEAQENTQVKIQNSTF